MDAAPDYPLAAAVAAAGGNFAYRLHRWKFLLATAPCPASREAALCAFRRGLLRTIGRAESLRQSGAAGADRARLEALIRVARAYVYAIDLWRLQSAADRPALAGAAL